MVPSSRHGDLEVAEKFQQEGLELGIGTVDLIDQQHRALAAAQGLQQRAFHKEAFVEDVIDARFLSIGANRQELLGVIPLIERLRRVDAPHSIAGG